MRRRTVVLLVVVFGFALVGWAQRCDRLVTIEDGRIASDRPQCAFGRGGVTVTPTSPNNRQAYIPQACHPIWLAQEIPESVVLAIAASSSTWTKSASREFPGLTVGSPIA